MHQVNPVSSSAVQVWAPASVQLRTFETVKGDCGASSLRTLITNSGTRANDEADLFEVFHGHQE